MRASFIYHIYQNELLVSSNKGSYCTSCYICYINILLFERCSNCSNTIHVFVRKGPFFRD